MSAKLPDNCILVRPKPKDRVLEFDISCARQSAKTFTVPFSVIQAAVMDLSVASAKHNTNGVVHITFLIATRDKAQVISFVPKKTDHNICRMVNLPCLKKQFVESAVVQGAKADQIKKLALASSSRIQKTACCQQRHCLRCICEISRFRWEALNSGRALNVTPGLVRMCNVLDEKLTGRQNSLSQHLATFTAVLHPERYRFDVKATTARVRMFTIFLHRRFAVKATASARRGASSSESIRTVNAFIEESDEAATCIRKEGYEHLIKKWAGLNVHMPTDDGGGEIRGRIADFRWYAQRKPPVCCEDCVRRSVKGRGRHPGA